MSSKKGKNYYLRKKPKLMNLFEKHFNHAQKVMKKYFNESKIEELIAQIRIDSEALIPQIPYIGGVKNPFTFMLIGSVATLAIFRALEKAGLTYREIGEFSYELYERINESKRRKLESANKNPGDANFEDAHVEFLQEFEKESQLKKYPGDWVMEFVDGEGEPFDYGLNFSGCGIHKFYKELGYEKYMPFICLSDFAEAQINGFGFTRTQTLGNGAPMCDHRYIKGGSTPRAWPPDNVQEFDKSLLKY